MWSWDAYRSQSARRNARLLAAHKAGKSYAELAKAYGISRQRVHQIVKAAAAQAAR